MIELYYKNVKIADFKNSEEAEAEARWRYFLKNDKPYEKTLDMPEGFFIVHRNDKN